MSDGGQAFPCPSDGDPMHYIPGMTMRQHYKGIAARRMSFEEIKILGKVAQNEGILEEDYVTAHCGSQADAMIKEDEEFKKGSEKK